MPLVIRPSCVRSAQPVVVPRSRARMVGVAARAADRAGLASPPGRVESRVSHDGLLCEAVGGGGRRRPGAWRYWPSSSDGAGGGPRRCPRSPRHVWVGGQTCRLASPYVVWGVPSLRLQSAARCCYTLIFRAEGSRGSGNHDFDFDFRKPLISLGKDEGKSKSRNFDMEVEVGFPGRVISHRRPPDGPTRRGSRPRGRHPNGGT